MSVNSDMPTTAQEIKINLNTDDSNTLTNVVKGNADGVSSNSVTPEELQIDIKLSEDKRIAFTLRDFLGSKPITIAECNVGIGEMGENLPYIDENTSVEEVQSDDDRHTNRGTDEVLNNAACRLRRWRAASRKLRRSRNVESLSPKKDKTRSSDNNCPRTNLADRLRRLTTAGGVTSSANELLTLAPPPPAATAPPSPSCLLTPTLAEQSTAEYFGSSPECCAESSSWEDDKGVPAPPPGPRYKLSTEGALRVCCFQHTRTVVDKILAAKFLRRWETHVLCMMEDYITSKTPCGLLERPLVYSSMQEVYCISRWDPARKYCLRIVMPNGSLLLQANDAYTRDQWYHSIIWRRNMGKYQNFLTKLSKKEAVIKELKNMVDFVMTTPLQDEVVTRTPLIILTNLLKENEESSDWLDWAESVVTTAAPLLADRCAGGDLCAVLARLCRTRNAPPLPALAPPVRRVLTRNVDFARAPNARRLVRDYISALSTHTSGKTLVRRFVEVSHGGRAACPHPRAAPNLAAVALAAIDDHYRNGSHAPHTCGPEEDQVLCFADILEYMCSWEDWLVVVGGVLQPVPICAYALRCPQIAKRIAGVLRALAKDSRCSAHTCLAPTNTVRATPPSWLRATAPSEPLLGLPHQELCQLWGDMLGSLLNCCCKRKSYLQTLCKELPDFLLVALTAHPAALEALCLMLEWEMVSGEQTQLEIIAALQGTEDGQQYYKDLCDRQQSLKRLQAEGGPRRLALPVRATDADVAALLEAGALGNLECLSLAFTSVTSACAQHLIKLPSLRYLNLWATQFGDSGLQLIAGHLPRLQVLNLCETPVSDKGIEALSAISSLRRLNLNSTKLSADAFSSLRERLPHLQEYDIRYTEAW